MQKDSSLLAQRCDKCQRFTNIFRKLMKELVRIAMPWQFAQWGINIVGPLPRGKM